MKIKFAYLSILTIVFCCSVLFLLFADFHSNTDVILLEEGEAKIEKHEREITDSLLLGYGWSEIADVREATVSAISMMQKQVAHPKFILVFYSGAFDPQEIMQQIRKSNPQAKLFGMESANAVFSSAGLHNSKTGAVVVLGFYASDFKVGLAGKVFESKENHTKNVGQIIDQAYLDAGESAMMEPTGIISSQVMGYSELFCEALNLKFKPTVSMVGGNSINSKVGLGTVIINDSVYKVGYGLALIFTGKKIGADFHGGFSGRVKYGVVTEIGEADNHIIKQIDNRPAITVYNEWADNKFEAYMNLDESKVVNESVLTPLSKAVRQKNGELHHVTLHPWLFNPDGSINGGVTVSVGDHIYYVEGDEQVLIKRSGAVARKAMIRGAMPYASLAGGIHIYCIGAGMQLGIEGGGKAGEMVDEISKNMNGKPFIGGFFGGEQGAIENYGFCAGNLMSAMMTFSTQNKK